MPGLAGANFPMHRSTGWLRANIRVLLNGVPVLSIQKQRSTIVEVQKRHKLLPMAYGPCLLPQR